ncbi:MAG: sugar-transfer associated ATP-grasp domain-containing protein [Thermodesulfobacteriota bacterium]|nr:sugar-transfer associated ATP-grasp domain-containing protein [Thermodesulfobacteriota bacterium]
MKEIQKSINPISWEFLTEDKSIFYRYCMSHGIPIPKLFAIFFKTTTGWSFNGSTLENKDDWNTFFDKDIPSEFVIKPSRGVYGKGINIYSKTNNGLHDPFGKSYKIEDLYEIMYSDPRYNCFVIQERLKNHPELVRLTHIQFLQTTRIVTLFDTKGECQLLFAFFKPIIGQNVKDNFEWGRTGNLKGEVSLNTGTITSVETMMPNKLGMKPVFFHPRTGIPFEGFQLPFWKETCLLVKDVAHKFLPIKTIGWDVAITPTGPCIVEGNMWWDPSHLHEVTDVDVVSAITGNSSLFMIV